MDIKSIRPKVLSTSAAEFCCAIKLSPFHFFGKVLSHRPCFICLHCMPGFSFFNTFLQHQHYTQQTPKMYTKLLNILNYIENYYYYITKTIKNKSPFTLKGLIL